jgi:rare lipoprotein A
MHPGRSSRALAVVLLLAALGLGACAEAPLEAQAPMTAFRQVRVAPEPSQPPELFPEKVPSFLQIGIASWYGARFKRRPTANGERFDPDELTAAHRSLPLPTIARVTNLGNGRSVIVRINDRGPYVGGRVLDLSRAAATALGMKADGIARVRIEVFDDDQPSTLVATSLSDWAAP